MGPVRYFRMSSLGGAKEGWPRNPPLPRVFLLLHVTTAPEHLEHKQYIFNAPTLGDVGSRVGMRNVFWLIQKLVKLQNQSFPCVPCSTGNVGCTICNQILQCFIDSLDNCVRNMTRAMIHVTNAVACSNCPQK